MHITMIQKMLIVALLFSGTTLVAQQEQQTLLRNSRISGGFVSPMFSWSHANNKTGLGAGGGLGVVFDDFFVGFFGMGETFERPKVGTNQLVHGYGGLWLGYTTPSHKLLHLYTSLKIAGGSVGTTDFEHDWDFDPDLHDATFVVIPEAGLELNVARWMRLSGTVGYRFVNGFAGWGPYGKKDLNAPVVNLTLRLGWFGR
ncbi:MAG: hypothetical protein H6574_25520, partial [Lewinellaceae bacterium]|nr:hypothetical protein [Saprospiraceae bacterium]MCB9334420.1 hypothetical protein [Lewinellaceae bacterium]